jgi:uncharacterized phage protein (TIGR02220 family)
MKGVIVDYFKLARSFWDYAFENPEIINPNDISVYFFAIEQCNRLGWKEKYGLPSTMAMEAIGIKSYNTYIKSFNKLVDLGFFKLIQRSKNQYSSNIIALSIIDKALNKALDKALTKHLTKQVQSTGESTGESSSSIIKQYTNIPYTNIQGDNKENTTPDFEVFMAEGKKEFSDEIIQVISVFNFVTTKKVNPTKGRAGMIKKLFNAGYVLSDFEEVVKSKYAEWKDDEKMKAFITPDTIFAEKNFVKYVENVRSLSSPKDPHKVKLVF